MSPALTKADPQSAILVALLRGPKKGMTVSELVETIDRAKSTVQGNLNVIGPVDRWVYITAMGPPRRFGLSVKGRAIARYRARRPEFRKAKAS